MDKFYKRMENNEKYTNWVKNNPATIGKKRVKPSLVDFGREVTRIFVEKTEVMIFMISPEDLAMRNEERSNKEMIILMKKIMIIKITIILMTIIIGMIIIMKKNA